MRKFKKPNPASACPPKRYNANILNPKCAMSTCKKAELTIRYDWPPFTAAILNLKRLKKNVSLKPFNEKRTLITRIAKINGGSDCI